MFPLVALLGSLILIAWLFRQDTRERPVGSHSLWVTGLWLLVISTRPIAYWVGSLESSTGSTREVAAGGPGNGPADLAVLMILILAARQVLARRNINWGEFVSKNFSIIAIYAFFLCSLLWADFPLAVFKRVFKDFSVVLFALTLLTEADPPYAIRKLFLRCSYLVFTLSVVSIKYFPAIGRNSTRSGENMFTGLTTQKNTLGEVVFTYLIILMWDLIQLRREERLSWTDSRVVRRCMMLSMGAWLLLTSDSQTSLLCLLVGILLFWATGGLLRMSQPKQKLVALGFGCLLLFGLDSTFQIEDSIIEALGRDSTLTGRINIWDQALAQPINRVVGAGFMMFWDGKSGQTVLDEMGVRINSAHNGYLEMLLDGGAVGVVLLAIMLLSRGNAILDRMVAGQPWGRIGFIFWVLALIQNLSESTFFRFSLLWFLLMLSMITPPLARTAAVLGPQSILLRRTELKNFWRAST